MTLNRRDFLKLSGVAFAGGLAPGIGFPQLRIPPSPAIPISPRPEVPLLQQPVPSGELGILYDTTKCIGCRACQMACKRWNNLPADPQDAAIVAAESQNATKIYDTPQNLSAYTWTLIKMNKISETDYHFINYQCQHCADAACVTVCPTGALYKDAQGFTGFDEDKCIGCGYCTQFCPYHVPHLRVDSVLTGKAKAAKCTFCQDRVLSGIGGPYCATVCPVGALTWGNRSTLLDQAKSRITDLHGQGLTQFQLYGETQAGGLGRMSIIYGDPAQYNLPANPVSPGVSRFWQDVVQTVGAALVGVTTIGALIAFLISRSNVTMTEVE
jgi:formate dehydrogenase iron-sulfur subunit